MKFNVLLLLPLLLLGAAAKPLAAQNRSFRDYYYVINDKGEKTRYINVKFVGEAILNGKHVFKYEMKEMPGSVQTIESSKIHSIRLLGSSKYDKAFQKYEKEKYTDAIAGFSEVKDDPQQPWWVTPYATYYSAECLRFIGKRAAAIAAFKSLTGNFPQNRFVAEALYKMAVLQTEMKDNAGASASIKQLQKVGNVFGPQWKPKGELLLADVQFASEDFNNALKLYRIIASNLKGSYTGGGEKASIYGNAMFRIGMCLIKNGDFPAAQTHYSKMIAIDNISVKAGGFLGLGEIKYEEKDYRKAALDFLRVLYLYNEVTQFQNDAAFGAGRCYANLFKAELLPEDKQKAYKMARLVESQGRADLRKQILKLMVVK
ncbi:tetratricopeptide repeat protein [Planctomycetota bacterium]